MYAVKLTNDVGFVSYLTYRNRLSWCKRTALKHAKEFIAIFGGTFVLEEI